MKPEATKSEHCIWHATFRQYVYTQAWVEFLIREISDPAMFAELCGRPLPSLVS